MPNVLPPPRARPAHSAPTVPVVVRTVPPPPPAFAERLRTLGAADRAAVATLAATPRTAAAWRTWRAVTHLGVVRATVLACLIPLLFPASRRAGVAITAVVLLSQLLVHAVKRLVGRPRPAHAPSPVVRVDARAPEPDPFSFPSGHAAAAMAVVLGAAPFLPAPLAAGLVLLAVVVALSRAVLGVHYLADVAAGAAGSIAAAALAPVAMTPLVGYLVARVVEGLAFAAAWGVRLVIPAGGP